MSEKLRESLSAVVDDEADEFELRRVLDELAKDPGLKASWARYHMIGTVLRGEYTRNATGLKERVWQELAMDSLPDPQEQEPAESDALLNPAAGSAHRRRWLSLGVAAGVAFLVVVGIGNLETGTEQPQLAAQSAPVNGTEQAVNQALALKEVATPLDKERAEAYKVAHSQQRFMINAPDPNAFAKMVSYQRR